MYKQVLKKEEYQFRLDFLQLRKGNRGRTNGNRANVKAGSLRHYAADIGATKKGGGREHQFEEFFQLVKLYTDCERLRGHHLEADDVFREFKDQVQKKKAAD